MNILSFIEDEEVIKKILKHLGLWDIKTRPPPRAIAPPGNIQLHHLVDAPVALALALKRKNNGGAA